MNNTESMRFVELLIERHYPALVRCAYLRLGNIHDAEDAAQDVFAAFLSAKNRPTDDEHAKAYLFRSVINRTCDIVRSRKHRDVLPLNDELDGEYDSLVYTEGDTPLISAVMTLPPHMRDAVYLHYYEDMTLREISKATGRNQATVGSDLRRAKIKLSEILKEEM